MSMAQPQLLEKILLPMPQEHDDLPYREIASRRRCPGMVLLIAASWILLSWPCAAAGADDKPPKVTITAPTSSPTFTTNTSPLTIGGSASDNVGVTQVTWSNSRGGSGTATGTTSWSAGGITLQSGTNVLSVTARDAAGNTRTDTLTVTYDP